MENKNIEVMDFTTGRKTALVACVALFAALSAWSQVAANKSNPGGPDEPGNNAIRTEHEVHFNNGGGGGGSAAGTRPFADRLQGIVQRGPGSRGKAMIIRSSESDLKEQANLEEDLSVMARILDKAVEESVGRRPQAPTAMGIDLFFSPGSSPMQNLFLEGYGALFMLRVGFPLVPPPSKEAKPSKEEQPVDSDWEEAKRELYGHRGDGKFTRAPLVEYDEEKVTRLKDGLLESLKNVSNIRNLKNDEVVTVCVTGDAESGRTRTFARAQGGKVVEEHETLISGPDRGPARGTIMTIKVKKADAEAFAKGKMNLEEFRKKAKITSYVGTVGSEMDPLSFGSGGGWGVRSQGF